MRGNSKGDRGTGRGHGMLIWETGTRSACVWNVCGWSRVEISSDRIGPVDGICLYPRGDEQW